MSSSSQRTWSTATTEASSSENDKPSAIAPSIDQARRTLFYSTQYWNELKGKSLLAIMNSDTIQFGNLDHQIPALPEKMKTESMVRGFASWALNSECQGGLSSRCENERSWHLVLPSNFPTLCSVSNRKKFAYTDSPLNGTTLLFFGWTYILSMALLERQELDMQYYHTPSEGAPYFKDGPCVDVNLGTASSDEWRWWNALTTPGHGWCSTGRTGTPWRIAYRGNVNFKIRTSLSDKIDAHTCTPPSSRQAVKYLARFASVYNLGGQSSLALAMALSLPLHNQTRSAVDLPAVSSFQLPVTTGNSTIEESILRDFSRLPRLMTISSNPAFFSSALWSIFWQDGIDCNLVSAWFDPAARVISPLVHFENAELLAHIFAERSPNIAPLWYGVLACGKTRTFHAIVDFLKTSRIPMMGRLIPEVGAWTGSPQSFMEITGSGPYLKENQVSRADVWRLRHDTSDENPQARAFKPFPSCPWPPFGSMLDTETELHVRSHLTCQRHVWSYSKWTWELENGDTLIDTGSNNGMVLAQVLHNASRLEYKNNGNIFPISKENEASELAVGDAFSYSATEMEMSGKDIYNHPWVRPHVNFPKADEPLDENASKKSKEEYEDIRQRALAWLERLDLSAPDIEVHGEKQDE